MNFHTTFSAPPEYSSFGMTVFLKLFLSLQALRLFRLASELESRAAALRLEALQHMTISMAGVDCRELFTLMTAFFGQGTNFADDPFAFLDGAPSIRPPLDLTDTDSDDNEGEKSEPSTPTATTPASTAATSTATSSTAAASSTDPPGPVDILEPKVPRVKARPKAQYADKVPSLAQTKGFFPLDRDSLHNTGIPENYHVKRAGSAQTGRSIYVCPYESECSMPPYSGDIASTGSHVRC